jgi:drug/metabolite transporter (DMT)-like permease
VVSPRTLDLHPVEAAPPGVGVAPPDLRITSRWDFRLVLALAAVWVLWGSTFAGMRYAVATIPPFAMASVRFTVAGVILYAFCALRGHWRIGRGDLVRASVTGANLLLLGNGVSAWTVQYLPTGINSLLLSLVPAWMALIAFVWGRERPTRTALVGMLLGFGGMALLLQPRAGGALPPWPATLAVLASVAWAFGSIYQRRASRTGDLLLATALQMTVGGVMIGLEAAAFGEWHALDVHAVSTASWLGLAWLIVCGSLFGYSAYLYTMQAADTALASTYAYINPMVSVLLGVVLFHERFTPLEALAGAITLGGVALMMVPVRRPV